MSYESHKYCNGNLYAGIVKDIENKQLFMDLYVGISMDVLKISYYLQDIYASIAMDVKNQQLFTRPICEYCIFKMALWKL
jgi:hypothetical protein